MLAIRIDQRISVKSSRAGDTFTGEVVDPVLATDNSVVVPKGATVGGVVDVSHRRGHFKGRSLLELRLTSLTLNGTQYPLTTRDLAESKKGKGRRSAAMIGGGAGLGMLVGGVATGGVGLVVGGLVGGGAGTAAAGLTGNRDLDIPAESIVHFKLADDLVVQAALVVGVLVEGSRGPSGKAVSGKSRIGNKGVMVHEIAKKTLSGRASRLSEFRPSVSY
jgi:hypothetical protein